MHTLRGMRKLVAGFTAASALLTPVVAASIDQSASAAAAVRTTRVQYDSPGSDTGSNSSLNAEWVRITNKSATVRALTGWRLRDAAGHVYTFPTFKLRPGSSVRVHTGRGANTGSDLYWRQGWYIWNNTGDKATLKNKAGAVIDTCSWGDGSGVTNC